MNEFLLNTLEYFSDRNKRCVSKAGGCQYSPTKTSDGCAIGRFLTGTPQELARWDSEGGYAYCADAAQMGRLPDIRPEWMKRMPEDFLTEMQKWHDSSIILGEEDEKDHLRRIIEEYNLDINLFKNYL